MTPLDALAVVLIVLPILDWLAAVLLLRASRRYPSDTLRERSRASIALAVAATLAGFLGAVRFTAWSIPSSVVVVLLALALVLISVPALLWLRLYWKFAVHE